MQVASKTLSEELFKLSGWEIGRPHESTHYFTEGIELSPGRNEVVTYPKYTLGYLIRKLPPTIMDNSETLGLIIEPSWAIGEWFAGYETDDHTKSFPLEAEKTPENALCQLAITLIKQGILEVNK